MPDIDILSVTKIAVGKTIPSPASEQIAQLLNHDLGEVEYVRGRAFDSDLKSPKDYVLVWFKGIKKWGNSHGLKALQEAYSKGA